MPYEPFLLGMGVVFNLLNGALQKGPSFQGYRSYREVQKAQTSPLQKGGHGGRTQGEKQGGRDPGRKKTIFLQDDEWL